MQGTLGSLDSLKGVPLHLALELTGVGLVACDASGMLTLISPTLQELFGMTLRAGGRAVLRRSGSSSSARTARRALATDEVPLMRARRRRVRP